MARKSVARVKATAVSAPSDESNTLTQRLNGRTPAEATAGMMVKGLAQNLLVTQLYSSMLPEVDTTEAFTQTLALAKRVVAGDRSGLEAILTAQVLACNAIFTDCVKRGIQNYQKTEIHDRLMRIGLRAQSQCRATAESIAVMQSPPTVFAKQANIASGPQQVNNGVQPPPRVRAGTFERGPNKLLGAPVYDQPFERVDDGTSPAATAGHSTMEAVATINRPEKQRRQGAGRQKRVQRRRTPATAQRASKTAGTTR